VETVLCTGSSGFIGSHIVEELKRRGYHVVTFDIYDNPLEDVRDIKAVRHYMKNVDYCLHLAANPYIPYGYEHPNEFFDTNATGTLNILNAARDEDVRVVYWSTSEVYGTAEDPQKPMNEDHRIRPHSTYALAKYAGDGLCFTYFKEHGLDVTIMRQFNCYGPKETWPYVIPEIISQLHNGTHLTLGNVNAERDFTYVEDAARAGVDVMECPHLTGQIVNCGSGMTWSIAQLATMLGNIMHPGKVISIDVDRGRLRPYDVDRLLCDNRKLRFMTGWEPEVGVMDGLRRTVDWFTENGCKWNYRVM